MPTKKVAIDLLDDCVISIPENPSWIEHHAAGELAKYVESMTGKKLEIVEIGSAKMVDAKNSILIQTEERCESGGGSVEGDSFIVGTNDKNVLILSGCRPRSTLYAVYDFLEKECGVGFFQDGDHIPKYKTLRFKAIDRTEKPYFARRVAPSPCAYTYTAKYWGVDEWKTELDYMAKRKLNTFYWTVGMATVLYRTWKRLGYDVPEPTEWDVWHEQLQKEVRTYAEKLDFDLVGQLWGGNVTKEFAEAHPEIRYVTFQWLDSPLSYYIYPLDPAFQKIMEAYVSEWERTYGWTNTWDNGPQGEVYNPAPDQPLTLVDLYCSWAKSFAQIINKMRPDDKLYISSWSLQSPHLRGLWKSFFEAFDTNKVIFADVWAETAPTYQISNYFGGRGEWLFGVIQTMGCVDHIHGDLLSLIIRIKDALDDPLCGNLTGICIGPECFHHNFLYFDLAAELAWDPRNVELYDFLHKYCIRRYGKTSAKEMAIAWDLMSRTVYGDSTETDPSPSFQTPLFQGFDDHTKRRVKQIPVTMQALNVTISEKENLKDNKFYRRDLIDIKRTLYGMWFDYFAMHLLGYFNLRDTARFEETASILLYNLDGLADDIAEDPYFHLSTEIDMAKERPGNIDDHIKEIRSRYTALQGMDRYPSCLDYAKTDRVELIRGYYSPRVAEWIKHLHDRMDADQPISRGFLLNVVYREITRSFIETGQGKYEFGPIGECGIICPNCHSHFYAAKGVNGSDFVTFD